MLFIEEDGIKGTILRIRFEIIHFLLVMLFFS
jgi:hypothetical protein